jgi:hypothetical protein
MEYIKDKAILDCDKGLFTTLLIVTSNNKIKNREGFFATDKDNIAGLNIPAFGTCAIKGKCKLDNDLSGKPLNWINPVLKIKILEHKPLSDNSKCICPLGGVISCNNSGQI